MKKGTLVYITIPDQKRKIFSGHEDFVFNPAIPLPLELAPGIDASSFNTENIKPEMILSGLLLDLALNPEGLHSVYYRNLVTALKPAISGELQKAAEAKAGNGDYKSALELIDLLIGLTGEDPELLRYRSFIREKENSGDDADFMEAVNFIQQGEEEKGMSKAREFLVQHPGNGKGWFVLGWALRCLARWNDAAACFEKAIELGCENADTRNELAICLIETGNLAEAENELGKALYLDPENIKIISNMGILAMKQSDNEKAAEFFRTVLELDPNDSVALAFFEKDN